MKKLLHLFLFAILWGNLNAQDWKPISSGEVYNYFNDSTLLYSSIWVDSVAVINSDSVFYLNKVLKKLDTILSDNSFAGIYLANQPQFLLSNISISNSGDILLRNNNSLAFLIKSNGSINDYWIFDSLNNIQATIIQVGQSLVFNSTDSTKTILLSTTDTIIISKNHGIIKFPIFNTNSNYVKLVGIEGRNIGTSMPRYRDIYNFNVGDVFYYKRYNGGRWGQTTTYKKIHITKKEIKNDTFIYHTNYISRAITVDGNYGMYENDTEYVSISDHIITYSDGLFFHKYNGEICGLSNQGRSWKPVTVSWNNTLNSLIKSIPRNPFCRIPNTDTLIEYNNPSLCSMYFISQQYGDGIGLKYYSYYYYSMSYPSDAYHIVLLGYTKEGKNYGTIISRFSIWIIK